MYSYIIRISFECHSYVTRVPFICHPYVTRISFVCHPYVTRMYSYVIHLSLVCTRMSPVCYSYVLVCHSFVCHSDILVCRLWFYHEPIKMCVFIFRTSLKTKISLLSQHFSYLILQETFFYVVPYQEVNHILYDTCLYENKRSYYFYHQSIKKCYG